MKTIRKRLPVQNLISKINSLDDVGRKDLATTCGTSIGNLRQIAYGFGGCSVAQATKIVKACDSVKLFELLPELNPDINSVNDDSKHPQSA